MSNALAVSELRFGRIQVGLRELCGHDVLAVNGDDTLAALRLLERLITPSTMTDFVQAPEQEHASARPSDFTAPERDRALAEVYLQNYGGRIRGEPRCDGCGEKFDMEFRLSELVEATWPRAPEPVIELDDGRRLRVPTGSDELSIRGTSGRAALQALVSRCTVQETKRSKDKASERNKRSTSKSLVRVQTQEPVAISPSEMAEALERAAPVLDLVLDALCPECGANNQLQFRMQSYLLQRLLAERKQIADHLDRLARAYGWSATEILSLPRQTRMELVELATNGSSWRAF